jgi:type II secretory pathway pseudopilin PulG
LLGCRVFESTDFPITVVLVPEFFQKNGNIAIDKRNPLSMIKTIINLVLVGIIAALAYMLINSIREPIEFKAELSKRENAVVEKLMAIRQLQDAHRTITGMYADNFDSLFHVLRTDSFMEVAVIGDPDDPDFDGTITYDTTWIKAIDSLRGMGYDPEKLDELRYVPFSDPPGSVVFDISADTIIYQKTPNVPVVMVGARYRDFMGMYKDPKYAKYNNSYDPNEMLKFGDLGAPNTSGNWE